MTMALTFVQNAGNVFHRRGLLNLPPWGLFSLVLPSRLDLL
jgi:hypothetical protein